MQKENGIQNTSGGLTIDRSLPFYSFYIKEGRGMGTDAGRLSTKNISVLEKNERAKSQI